VRCRLVDRVTLEVLSGEDLLVDPGTQLETFGSKEQLNNLCAGNLAPQTAFYNSVSGLGCADRIYTTGEEDPSSGRVLAYLLNGVEAPRTGSVLPALGLFKVEVAAACPHEQDLTLVMITDDSNPGLVAAYLGQKKGAGAPPLARAGLLDGRLYAVRLAGLPSDTVLGSSVSGVPFDLVALGGAGDAVGSTYADLRADAEANSATFFSRPEDGGWRPQYARQFLFCTTHPARLWTLEFSDLSDPLAGGVASVVVDAEFGDYYDNLAFSADGDLLFITEDGVPPNRIWRYDLGGVSSLDRHSVVGSHPSKFADNEFSGIVRAEDVLGPGWYLFDNQRGGQLLAVHDSTGGAPSGLQVFGISPMSVE
jgi:hypothetical protein